MKFLNRIGRISESPALMSIIGFGFVLVAVGFAQRTPRAKHEATVDHATIRPAPLAFRDEVEAAGGRRWLILRTGGVWR